MIRQELHLVIGEVVLFNCINWSVVVLTLVVWGNGWMWIDELEILSMGMVGVGCSAEVMLDVVNWIFENDFGSWVQVVELILVSVGLLIDE
jgi:hypothetical protein